MPSRRAVRQAAPSAGAPAWFTVERANRALVLVRRIVGDIVAEHPRVADLQEAAEAAAAAGDEAREAEARRRLVAAIDRVHRCLEELDDVGVELRDFRQGIVDFPCVIDGEVLCLCWRHGERHVAHWHEPGAGFAERQPLAFLPTEAASDAAATRPGGPRRTSACRS